MNKVALLSLAALTLATAAVAQEKKPAAKSEVACAVMPDHKVDVKKATAGKMFADYKGRRYFFCCAGCPGQFKANPAKFAKAESIPTPKAAKPSKKG